MDTNTQIVRGKDALQRAYTTAAVISDVLRRAKGYLEAGLIQSGEALDAVEAAARDMNVDYDILLAATSAVEKEV